MPTVSVILASYNVSSWLGEFLTSLDEQIDGLTGYELIFVDDGSTDDTAARIEEWIARSGADAKLIRQANTGAGGARNAGLEHARGQWATFWDPDDMLMDGYCGEIRRFLASPQAAEVDLVVSRIVWFNEATGRRQHHPLNYRFEDGNRIVDLESEPRMIHLATNTGFYRMSVLRERGLKFDSRVVPTFEDGHLTGRYLAGFERPKIALCGDAHYLYRRRADDSSLVQTAWSREEKYTAQPRYGWLDLLQTVKAERGRVPHWTQHVVLYELQWYFRFEQAVPNRTAWVPAPIAAEFHRTLAEVVEYLDDDYIQTFASQINGFRVDMAAALMLAKTAEHSKGGEHRTPYATVDRIDSRRRLARLRYYFGTQLPVEDFRANGRRVVPRHATTRLIQFLGRPLAHERIIWFPATDTVSLSLDGHPIRIEVGQVGNDSFEAAPDRTWRELAGQAPPSGSRSTIPTKLADRRRRIEGTLRDLKRRAPRAVPVARSILADQAVLRLSATPPVRKQFANAWVLMDRDTAAQDNAEHLYRHLRAEQPEINAWFVLNRDSIDWDRLSAEGFRLLEHGSPKHKLALLNCRHLVSSHADGYVVKPLSTKRYGHSTWNFSFLQHGVIKDDLSTWLNPKPLDLFLTSTRDEYESIAGAGNRYRYSSLEIALTGLPRHDRLRKLGRAAAPEQRKTLVFMPTWRWHLVGERSKSGNKRSRIQGFWESEFMQGWRAVLESDRLRKAAEAHGVSIKMVMHPNMEEYAADSPLPAEISVSRFADVDIQELLAGAVALVTDFSSLAFDAAYIDRPVVYYQFDMEEFYGNHVYTKGYWSYPEHGFGPVCPDAESALDSIIALIENGGTPAPEHLARIERTFEYRDGQCCERTVQRILALERPPTAAEMYVEV
ncbi:MAG TPA: CDP-glycerol glycerophosphotransferase family protein [Sporichthyaceae bacterium]|nr:CDP-glycerol glycerophosphotransferase family protein [Sporichthyaceae bacterium]